MYVSRGLGIASTYLSQIDSAIPQYCPSCSPSLVAALVNQESGGNQFTAAGAPLTSSAGAVGLFQLMPATAAGLNVNPADPAGNIQGGLTYLQQLYDKYGDWNEALIAYNEGPGTLAAGTVYPSSQQYADSILSASGISDSSALPSDTADLSVGSPTVTLSSWAASLDQFSFLGLSGTAWAGISAALLLMLFAFRRT